MQLGRCSRTASCNCMAFISNLVPSNNQHSILLSNTYSARAELIVWPGLGVVVTRPRRATDCVKRRRTSLKPGSPPVHDGGLNNMINHGPSPKKREFFLPQDSNPTMSRCSSSCRMLPTGKEWLSTCYRGSLF